MEGARKTSDLQNSKVNLAPSRLLLVGSHDSYTEWRFFDGRGGRDGAARHNGVFLSFHTFMFSIYTSTRTVDTTYFSYGYDYIIFLPQLKSPVMRNDLAHIVWILLCMLQILSCAIFVDISHSPSSSP